MSRKPRKNQRINPNSKSMSQRIDSIFRPRYKSSDSIKKTPKRFDTSLKTPSTFFRLFWDRLGIKSHIAIPLFMIPVFYILYELSMLDETRVWSFISAGMILISYGIYYFVAPRESKRVVSRLENLYDSNKFATISSGIVVVSTISTVTLILGLSIDKYVKSAVIAETSVTIATVGFLVGLVSSYILVRVLVARAVPVQSEPPIIDRFVNMSSAVELLFVLAAIGAPLYVISAAFLWNSPELFTLPLKMSHEAGAVLLFGSITAYISAVSRL